MRNCLAIGLVLIASTAGPAISQETGPLSDCRSLVKDVPELQRLPGMTVDDVPGGCRVTNVAFQMSEYVRYVVDEVTLLVPDLLAVWPGGEPFAEAELTAHNIRYAPDTGSPLQNYIIEMQGQPLDLHLAYRWDEESQVLELADFSVRTAEMGGIRVSGRLSNVPTMDVTSSNLADFIGSIENLSLSLDDGRFFSTYLVVPLISLLPSDQDPRPLIASYQQAATAAIEGLPADRVSSDSKSALIDFIAGFPFPKGGYSLDVTADPPLPLSALDITSLAELPAILARLTLAASRAAPQD